MKRLERLLLAGNELAALPDTLDGLEALLELSLHGNRLVTLPPSFGTFPVLLELDLANNGLTELPCTFGARMPALMRAISHARSHSMPAGGGTTTDNEHMSGNQLCSTSNIVQNQH